MKILISSIGSRGDVQPLLALALELKALGHEPVLCAAPNFRTWVESFSALFFPIGLDTRQAAARIASAKTKPSKAQLRNLAAQTVRAQFQATAEAAQGCDAIVVAGALQTAGRSIAQANGIPYVYAAYCPAVLRSPGHPPPKIRTRIRAQSLPSLANRLLWRLDERSWNHFFRSPLNAQRAELGLPGVSNVARHVAGGEPWLAADATLGPAAPPNGQVIVQTGAWLLSDTTPLPDEIERFLAAGEPPLYFGFGSMQTSPQACRVLIEAARALGYRSIVSRGWGQLQPPDGGTDCIAVSDVSHERLFPRLAAVVHHGGAGTTTAAARAGAPQLIVPHVYDQYYWAHRVQRLGIGVAGPRAARLSTALLVRSLRASLAPATRARARALAQRITLDGARIAAERLVREFG